MNSNLRCVAIAIAAIAIWCALPTSTNADIPQPKNATEKPRRSPSDYLVTFVIESSDDYQARLYIPEEMMAVDTTATPTGMSAVGTTVSGVALSLSIVCGGLWLAKSRKRLGTASTVAAGAVFLVLVGTASYTFANASPYPIANPGTLVKATPNGEALSGKVRVMKVPSDGEGVKTIRLLLPREDK